MLLIKKLNSRNLIMELNSLSLSLSLSLLKQDLKDKFTCWINLHFNNGENSERRVLLHCKGN